MQKETAQVITEEQKIEQARKISVKEGAFSSLMDGFGIRYITPYALALGATNPQIALLSSFPGFIGNFFQLLTLHLMNKSSRKKIILWCISTQAMLWLPLIVVGWLYFFNGLSTTVASYLVIAVYSLLILAGALGNPAWSSWMRDILTSKCGEYFSNRNKIITGVVLISMLLGGIILDSFQESNVFFGFAIIFTIAFIGRTIAAYLFTKKYEPKYVPDKKSYFSLLSFIEHVTKNNFGRFVILISLISLSTAVAGPFFAVYMLKELQLSYFSYTLIILSPVVSTLVFLPLWGKFSDKHGNVKILKITGCLIPIIPLLWMLSWLFVPMGKTNLVLYLFFLEILGGFTWAGFNHASATFIYEAVSKEKMPYCTTYLNIFTGTGIFVGAMLGGYFTTLDIYPIGITPILATFFISSVMRFISVSILLPIIKEVKPVEPFSVRQSVKHYFKEKTATLTTQFWRFVGFKPIKIVAPNH